MLMLAYQFDNLRDSPVYHSAKLLSVSFEGQKKVLLESTDWLLLIIRKSFMFSTTT